MRLSYKNLIYKIPTLLRDIVIVVAVVLVIGWWQSRDMLDTSGQVQIQPLTVTSLKGESTIITAQAGKPTLLYFFAPWCFVCKASIGNLNDLATDETQIIVIALDYQSTDEVTEFLDDVDVALPVYLGTPALQSHFKITGFPSYYLLNSDFVVVDKAIGYSTSAGLKVRAWLAQ